jgi:hypothetical protein
MLFKEVIAVQNCLHHQMMEAVRTSETSVDNYFTRQCIPEDNSEHHTRRRESLKSHEIIAVYSENHAKPVNTKCRITDYQSRWVI